MIYEYIRHVSTIDGLDDMDNKSLTRSSNFSRYGESKIEDRIAVIQIEVVPHRQGLYASSISTSRPSIFSEPPLHINGVSIFLDQHGH